VTQTSQMTVENMTDVICSALSDVERFRTVIPSSNMTRGQFLLRYFENGCLGFRRPTRASRSPIYRVSKATTKAKKIRTRKG
jgi:hypothetical protein